MDTLARICVSQPMKEVIAIGVQFNYKDGFIDIIIAGNHDHNDSLGEVKKHLEKVLNKVQRLGQLYANERNTCGEKPEKETYDDGHRITQCARELKEMIVTHSAAKLHKRISKRWSTFTPLIRKLIVYMRSTMYQENTTEEMQFYENLLQIADLLRDIYDILHPKFEGAAAKLERDKVTSVCVHLTGAWSELKLLRETSKMDVMRRVQKFSRDTEFPLIHYLEGVLSLHVYFTTLVNWAHSPRLRASLSMKFHVHTLASSSKNPNFPTTEAGWTTVLNGLLEAGDVEAEDDSVIPKVVGDILSRYKSPTKHCPTHCEVALVQHYHQHFSTVPPYTYIGVSKLSCLPCHLFLQEYAKQTGKRFKTKGTHSKIYYPWGFPGLGNKALEGSLQEAMAEEIARRVGRHLVNEGQVRQRTRSDSTSKKKGAEGPDHRGPAHRHIDEIFHRWSPNAKYNWDCS